MHWITLPLIISGVAAAAVDQEAAPAKVGEETDRDGKLFSVFQIVKFNNDACNAVDGTMGTCYTASECTAKGGTERGPCASGFGVCCVSVVDPCGTSAVSLNNSYIVNPGYPNNVGAAGAADCSVQGTGVSTRAQSRQTSNTYTWTISKASSDIVQFRLDFEEFEISDPASGDCNNDTLMITGADAVTLKTLPTNLCGTLTGSHIYLSVKSVDTVTVTITLTSVASQKWKILSRQYDSTQTDYLAPRGCLQYYRDVSGDLMSFNYNDGNGELLNNQMYSMCIEQRDEYCDIALTENKFDLGGSSGSCQDSITLGTTQFCGSSLGTTAWNYTGSYMVPVMSDADNSAMNVGFSIGFILLPC